MGTREVVTLQFGSFANHVGSHYWNVQDESCIYMNPDGSTELNHDVLFRNTVDFQGHPYYVPRTVAFELKGGYGSVVTDDDIEEAKASSAWSSGASSFRSEGNSQNEYMKQVLELRKQSYNAPFPSEMRKDYQLESVVTTWTDFLKQEYHQRSFCGLHGFKSGIDAFDVYTEGYEAFKTEEKYEDNIDQIRYFTEECDSLQGIQIFCTQDTGFGGFCQKVLEMLRDDYPVIPIVIYGTSPIHQFDEGDSLNQWGSHKKLLNEALSSYYMTEYGSAYLPLTFQHHTPRPGLDPMNYYQTGAYLAGLIDSSTIPYRKTEGPQVMGDFWQQVAFRPSNKIVASSIGFNIPETNFGQICHLIDTTNSLSCASYLEQYTSVAKETTSTFSESIQIRGYDLSAQEKAKLLEKLDLQRMKSRSYRFSRSVTKLPFCIPSSFPNTREFQARSGAATMTHLRTSDDLQKLIDQHAEALKDAATNPFHRHLQVTYQMNSEEFRELENSLLTMSDSYANQYSDD